MKQLDDKTYETLHRSAYSMSIALQLIGKNGLQTLVDCCLKQGTISCCQVPLSTIEDYFKEVTKKVELIENGLHRN